MRNPTIATTPRATPAWHSRARALLLAAAFAGAALPGCGGTDEGSGEPPAPGEVDVVIARNTCPTIERLVVAPAEAPLGAQVHAEGAANDEDGEPVTFLWTATAGTIGASTAANTSYVCATEGRQRVTLTVSDGKCSREASVEVACGVR